MDFRRNKDENVSLEARTDRRYGIYDGGFIFQYREPLTDKQIEQITKEIESNQRLHDSLDRLKYQNDLETQIDRAVEQTLDRALQKAFKKLS